VQSTSEAMLFRESHPYTPAQVPLLVLDLSVY
jgi:hypothetical protein